MHSVSAMLVLFYSQTGHLYPIRRIAQNAPGSQKDVSRGSEALLQEYTIFIIRKFIEQQLSCFCLPAYRSLQALFVFRVAVCYHIVEERLSFLIAYQGVLIVFLGAEAIKEYLTETQMNRPRHILCRILSHHMTANIGI